MHQLLKLKFLKKKIIMFLTRKISINPHHLQCFMQASDVLVTGVFDADSLVYNRELGTEERPLDRIDPNDDFRSVTVILVKYLCYK